MCDKTGDSKKDNSYMYVSTGHTGQMGRKHGVGIFNEN